MKIQDFLSKLYSSLVETLLPQGNVCHLCERALDGYTILCDRCCNVLNKQKYPAEKMAECDHPPLEVCIAAFPHEAEARKLVHQLKYDTNASVVPLLAEAISNALIHQPAVRTKIDCVMPVPLHPIRENERGYNQAALLAREVCFQAELELNEHVLVRKKQTTSQIKRSRENRLRAMQGVFSVVHPEEIKDKHILLVDDVITTGATAMACAEVLLNAGAQSVSLLTVCRAEKKKARRSD